MSEKKYKVTTSWRDNTKVEEIYTLPKLLEYILDELESKQSPDFEDGGYMSGSNTVEEIE